MKLNSNDLQKISLPTLDGYSLVQPERIVCIQLEGRQSVVHTTSMQEPIRSLATLSDLEERLRQFQYFFRTHRSCIVNMLHINHVYEKELKVVTSLGEVPISRENLKRLKSLYCAQN